jgi:hypothetical protein
MDQAVRVSPNCRVEVGVGEGLRTDYIFSFDVHEKQNEEKIIHGESHKKFLFYMNIYT